MRALVLLTLLAARAAVAQDPAQDRDGSCNVVSERPIDVNREGRLERPPPTPAECETAATLESRFLAMRPGDFRRIWNPNRAPELIRNYLKGIVDLDETLGTSNVQIGRYPRRPGIAIWLSTELAVVAYRTTDFEGTATNVLLADLDAFTACAYVRWRGGELPASLSIAEIQDALDKGRLGNRETPACHLRTLTID
jgi:hypothetical protein